MTEVITQMPVFKTPPIPMPSVWKVCHYNHHTFFQFDMKKGEIQDYHHQRNILVGEDFIVALLKGLEHEVGESAGWLLYTIGYNWGKADAIEFDKWFYEFYHLTLQTANLHFALETWWWPLTAQGWGTWKVDLTSLKEGFIFVDLFDSAVAKTLGYVGKPVCHLYAGLIAGFFSAVFDKNLSGTEVQCYAMGNDFCRFLVGSEKRIRATEFWLSSGATVADIEARFASQEIAADLELLVSGDYNE
ncbi:MAG: 4-vinyl reductase [Cyanobacteria bacterium M5B4]|nr:MAG: 4-vinyl reductase [Cyanobacteria bacterium M5B4]